MTVEFEHLPGYHVRRLQQIAVAIFLDETKSQAITPVQYAALSAVARQPASDQRSLARAIGIDTSTIANVVDRLEARGLVARNASPDDRRVRLLTITREGKRLLLAVEPGALRAQKRILAPLPDAQRAQFMEMLALLVQGNSAVSRAPSEMDGPVGELVASPHIQSQVSATIADSTPGKSASKRPSPSSRRASSASARAAPK